MGLTVKSVIQNAHVAESVQRHGAAIGVGLALNSGKYLIIDGLGAEEGLLSDRVHGILGYHGTALVLGSQLCLGILRRLGLGRGCRLRLGCCLCLRLLLCRLGLSRCRCPRCFHLGCHIRRA